jgi:hypothetical protein
MNCWGIRIYFNKSRFLLKGGLFVYMGLLSGHEKIITKSGISLNVGTLIQGFTVFMNSICVCKFVCAWKRPYEFECKTVHCCVR